MIDWRLATSRLRRLLPARCPAARAPRPRQRDAAQRAAYRCGPACAARLFTVLILATAFWGVASFVEILGVDGLSYLDLTHTAVFADPAAVAGAVVLDAGRRCGGPGGTAAAPPRALAAAAGDRPDRLPRVAIVAPIYNEDTERVFAGFRAMWEDLRGQPHSERVDLFILSDTTDPDIWLAELDAWQRLRQAVPGAERIYYRRRLRNLKRKTGNIEDFVTRWGGAYGYMIVLDADSLMSGRAMMQLWSSAWTPTRRSGLIQAPPKLVRGQTVFARMLQFAGELYGPLSAAGLSYWALGEGNYWGHNAIIRVAPFAELCGLPLLSGRAPLGGEIMSHDFVEAALLRRGGWQVWIADDLGESYEEPPPSIADFATRDRRWCQGNMQHHQGAVRARPALGQPAAPGDRHPVLPDLAAVAAVPAAFGGAGLGADLWQAGLLHRRLAVPDAAGVGLGRGGAAAGHDAGPAVSAQAVGAVLALIDGQRRRRSRRRVAACSPAPSWRRCCRRWWRRS